MKNLPTQLGFLLETKHARRDIRSLLKLVALLVAMVVVFSVAFHFVMAAEGQRHSWITGFYWTLVVMTTLGFGDVTFQSDLGRAFSIAVLLSGVLFLLVLLPFTFIQFFYAPWVEAQRRARAPRVLPEETRGHVILTRYDPVAESLIDRLGLYGHDYVVLEPELTRALELHDLGVKVMVGAVDDLASYRNARADRAALVVTNWGDYENTNVTFTVRELTERTPVVATVRDTASVDVLRYAGATHVLELGGMLGRALARRTIGGATRANVVARFDEFVIAEAAALGTPLAGKRIVDSGLRPATGLTIVGLWHRGVFTPAVPETVIEPSGVLVLAGTEAQFDAYDRLLEEYGTSSEPVVIIGGGRVGRAAGAALESCGVPYRIIERRREMIRDDTHYVHGNAADPAVLERAGIRAAPTTIISTADDASNVFLTVICRRLRPNMQVIARANLERNVSTLHRAGADLVMSAASMGADAVLNVIERNDLFMVAEGLDVFRVPVPDRVVGRTLAESQIREQTGCIVLALDLDEGLVVGPAATTVLPANGELILIGTTEAERRFISEFKTTPRAA